MSESVKMSTGQWYDANFDPELLKEREKCAELVYSYNQSWPSDTQRRGKLISRILQKEPENLCILSPVTFDYGYLTSFGKDVFVNSGCYFMDGGKISIGDHCFIGPNCQFYTATHPLAYKYRNLGLEKALPIRVEKNCWFGGNVIVLPGVTIHEGCVIGAGAIVTEDLPANHVCIGVPCRPVYEIDQDADFIEE